MPSVSSLTAFMPCPIAVSFYLSFALFLSPCIHQQEIDQRELDYCLSFQYPFLFSFALSHSFSLILYTNVLWNANKNNHCDTKLDRCPRGSKSRVLFGFIHWVLFLLSQVHLIHSFICSDPIIFLFFLPSSTHRAENINILLTILKENLKISQKKTREQKSQMAKWPAHSYRM